MNSRMYGTNTRNSMHILSSDGNTLCGEKYAHKQKKTTCEKSWMNTCHKCETMSKTKARNYVAVKKHKWSDEHILSHTSQKSLCGKIIIDHKTRLIIVPTSEAKNLCQECASEMVKSRLLEE